MKLSLPGTSSDLDEARAIARRLSRGLTERAPSREERSTGYVSFVAEKGARRPEPQAVTEAPRLRGARPRWSDETEASAPPAPPPEPDAEDAGTPFGGAEEVAVAVEAEASVVTPDGPAAEYDAFPAADDAEPELPVPGLEGEVDALLGEPTDVSVDALVEGLVAESGLEEEPPPPSWGEILEVCRERAQAQGALLIGASTEVVESSGEWPPAGVAAVAAKLMPIVEKKQRTAPGAPVSVRLGDQILTAWPMAQGAAPFTVAFLADVPLPAEVRQDIEVELARGSV